MCAKYSPTALPVRLDISRTDTAAQLQSGSGHSTFPVGHARNARHESRQERQQEEMNRMFFDVVNGNLRDFLSTYALGSVSGDSASVFDEWVRSFHSEYDDNWYSKNRDRLARSFRPIWDEYFNIPSSENKSLILLDQPKRSPVSKAGESSVPDLLEAEIPSPKKHPTNQPLAWMETCRLVLKVFLIAGWTFATVGVALFTYSEAYPPESREEKKAVLGSLTLSQCGFWLIFTGVAIVSVSVAVSQIIACIARKSDIPPPVAVTTGMGTGYNEEEDSSEDAETSSLIGSNKVNYGSTVFNPSPFSASSVLRAPSTVSPNR